MKTKIATYLGLKGKIRHHAPQKNKSSLIQAHLRAFYERDDVSKMTAGKNEIKTQRKQKKQRRYLLGTLRKLHQKYIHEGGKLSFATFKRYRPFYVLPPKAEKRDACACKRHENLQMKATVLEATGLIGTKDLDELLGMVVCDIKSKKCAYGECELCKNKCVNFTIRDKKANDSISWYEWVLKPHEYKPKRNSDVTKTMKKISKEKKTGTLEILMEAFQEELQNFKTHSYNIIHQYQEYRRCTKNLDEHTVALHIDFSENYTCKLSTEIQAMHFDGSRQQISLHTGIMYSTNGNQSFASMSPNKEHGPDAIWAHLLPVLELIKRKMPKPRTAKEPLMEWGRAIKRRLDSFVAYGSDIPDAKTAYELLQASETEIQLFYIPDDAVLNESVNLVPVPNTMKIHQIIINVDSANSIFYRYLSCFCQKSRPGFCNCLNVKSADLLKPIVVKNEKSITPKKKITVLSDIRHTEENKSYFDLTQYSPFNLKEVDPKRDIIASSSKENIMPFVDKICAKTNNPNKRKLININRRKNKKHKTEYESSTDEMRDSTDNENEKKLDTNTEATRISLTSNENEEMKVFIIL
ncbi:unnamed protein product [Euphydryas editha]|uniref:Uncharacterized protein n=1 Tax=Euphydryas editha TaxID=104508 RepID=A0AAU9UDT6_EUPED|nr:unnamed protein product [Euphydryas editha]